MSRFAFGKDLLETPDPDLAVPKPCIFRFPLHILIIICFETRAQTIERLERQMKQAQHKFGASGGAKGFGEGVKAHAVATVDTAAAAADDGPYDEAAIAELIYMIEEEKLAGDVYDAFFDLYGLKIFDRIAASEDRHFEALVAQAEALGLDTDSFVFAEPGVFQDEGLQDLYDTLIATGSASVTAALEVGAAIEEKDMVDIAAAIDAVDGTALAAVYQNLLDGSAAHLAAFDALLG